MNSRQQIFSPCECVGYELDARVRRYEETGENFGVDVLPEIAIAHRGLCHLRESTKPCFVRGTKRRIKIGDLGRQPDSGLDYRISHESLCEVDAEEDHCLERRLTHRLDPKPRLNRQRLLFVNDCSRNFFFGLEMKIHSPTGGARVFDNVVSGRHSVPESIEGERGTFDESLASDLSSFLLHHALPPSARSHMLAAGGGH